MTVAPATTTTTMPFFEGSIDQVDAARLGHSWHEGCPVDLGDLRLVAITHWGFDGETHAGEIIAHSDHARALLAVFESLFDAGYPIEAVIPIGDLPEDAEERPGYSNTSGFHCRVVSGGSGWSQHAFGLGVELNPHLNPYIKGTEIWPVGSDKYVDRSLGEKGMISPDDLVVTAFASIGWGRGGNWNSLKDYHHFSANGH
jgi:hypothetical protein